MTITATPPASTGRSPSHPNWIPPHRVLPSAHNLPAHEKPAAGVPWDTGGRPYAIGL